jgi:hypothetical protein
LIPKDAMLSPSCLGVDMSTSIWHRDAGVFY